MFADRRDAGQRLAAQLEHLATDALLVCGLARGGVIVAAEIAARLLAPLQAIVVRKLGAPHNSEYGIGAVAPSVAVFDDRAIAALGLTRAELEPIVQREQAEVARRLALYRQNGSDLHGRTVILVDDGLATGYTALAAVRHVRHRSAARVVFAAPVISVSGAELLSPEVDDIVAVEQPSNFFAVGEWYKDFRQVDDQEVLDCLRRS